MSTPRGDSWIYYWFEAMRAMRDVGPTTACFECGSIMPIGDTYLSKVDQRALCEGCFSSRKDRRLAKEVPA